MLRGGRLLGRAAAWYTTWGRTGFQSRRSSWLRGPPTRENFSTLAQTPRMFCGQASRLGREAERDSGIKTLMWGLGTCGILVLGLGLERKALMEGRVASIADDTREIEGRLRRVSSTMTSIVLPWKMGDEGGRRTLKFTVSQDSDLFCLLITSILQLGSSKDATSEARSMIGGVRVWDDEKTSTGIQIQLGGAEGMSLTLSLPWATVLAQGPEVKIVASKGGFSKDELDSLARLIIMGNTSSKAPATDPFFDFFFGTPGVHMSRQPGQLPDAFQQLKAMLDEGGLLGEGMGLGGEAGMDAGRRGNMREGRESDVISQLRALGVSVYNTGEGSSSAADTGLPWDFLAGVDAVKQEVDDTVMLALKHPDAFVKITKGTRKKEETNRPKAVLFEGPPGCGKTSMGRMMAARASIPMLYVPLEAVVSKWYGEGEKKLAQVFNLAAKLGGEQGVLLFLDEVEALGVSRDSEIHEASRRLLSVLLRSIDGFVANDKVIVIGATNRVQDIDSALRSRFDLSVKFALPDEKAREDIFALFTKHLSASDRRKLAAAAVGFSGRNIKEVCEQAERRWAAKMIRGEVREGSLPQRADYEDGIRSRMTSGLQ